MLRTTIYNQRLAYRQTYAAMPIPTYIERNLQNLLIFPFKESSEEAGYQHMSDTENV